MLYQLSYIEDGDPTLNGWIRTSDTIHPKYVFPTALALFFTSSKNPFCHLTLQRYDTYYAAYLRSWKKFCFFAKIFKKCHSTEANLSA